MHNLPVGDGSSLLIGVVFDLLVASVASDPLSASDTKFASAWWCAAFSRSSCGSGCGSS
jgi:hypothetical protein